MEPSAPKHDGRLVAKSFGGPVPGAFGAGRFKEEPDALEAWAKEQGFEEEKRDDRYMRW